MKALVRKFTGKAIHWRGFVHSVNCGALKDWNLLRSSPSHISAPTQLACHLCKNGTQNTSFCNTRGRTPKFCPRHHYYNLNSSQFENMCLCKCNFAKSSPIGIPKCSYNQRIFNRNCFNSSESIWLGSSIMQLHLQSSQNWFKLLPPQNGCNYFDGKGGSLKHVLVSSLLMFTDKFHSNFDMLTGFIAWRQGSTGAERSRCVPKSAANNLEQIPQKMGVPKSLFWEVFSEQLSCRSAEVKIFSVFLCQRCREIWREILVKFSALRFPGLGMRRKISPKFHVKDGVKNGKFHANFTLPGRSAEFFSEGTPWDSRRKGHRATGTSSYSHVVQ